jgi:xylan 1,4-beta-xylosidase
MIPVDAIIADSVRGEPDIGVVASIDDERLTVLLWNYHDVAGGANDRREVALALKGLPSLGAGAYSTELTIDDTSGNSYTKWLEMGSPQTPTAGQIAALHQAAEMQRVTRDFAVTEEGKAQLNVSLPRQSVKLIEIVFRPKSPPSR